MNICCHIYRVQCFIEVSDNWCTSDLTKKKKVSHEDLKNVIVFVLFNIVEFFFYICGTIIIFSSFNIKKFKNI